jgi:hypothetical protein
MPNDLLIRITLHGGILPGVVSLIALALLWWRYTKKTNDAEHAARAPTPPTWALPILIAAGVIAADWVVKQSFAWWPGDNTKRVVHAVALIGLLAAAESTPRLPSIARVITRAAAFAAATWMLTEGYRPGVLNNTQLWMLVAGAGLWGTVLATLADRSLSKTPGWTAPAAALALLAGIQPFLHFAGFSSGSLALVGALAVLTNAVIVGAIFKKFTLAPGAATMIVGLVLIGLLGAGIQSEPKSVPALILVALSPLALTLRFRGPVPTALLRAGVAGAFIGAAMGTLMLPAANAPAEDDPYADYFN